MNIRVGAGYDIHCLAAGRKLILGGLEIPYPRGLQGHSDADVLLHAVCDALLGAAALGDIGEHFPDTDPRFKDCDSKQLLKETAALVAARGFRVGNLDCCVVAQEPKLSPYKKDMAAGIARLLGVGTDAVSVKAKTNERCDAVGRGEAIVAFATVVLIREA